MALEKYLAHYAEVEARSLPPLGRTFGHVVVIPAYDEGNNLFTTLKSIPPGPLGDVLTILVVNTPADTPLRVELRSQQLIERLGSELELGAGSRPLFRSIDHPRGTLLCIDRTGSRSLPAGQGVGLARKIGCDVALHLHARGSVRSAWIHTTDADVKLPRDYFEAAPDSFDGEPPAALIYPFWHHCEPPAALADAMQRYEVFLRYYVLGLADAGSPYAFHTLGSTLAIHASAYAKVRGFPRRSAGEDFYLVNKLAKVGHILQLQHPVLLIGGRSSHRVPFGTGAALKQILVDSAQGRTYRVYDPEVFQCLKVWLTALELLCIDLACGDLRDYLEAAGRAHGSADIEQLHREMLQAGFLSAASHARQISHDASTMSRHLHTWFDGFRTLKLIHRLTRFSPKVELLDAIRHSPFLEGLAKAADDLEKLRRTLAERHLHASSENRAQLALFALRHGISPPAHSV
jgi:hypothetical protein